MLWFLNLDPTWLTNLSKSLRKPYQSKRAGVGKNDGPFPKTDFWEDVGFIVDKLMSF